MRGVWTWFFQRVTGVILVAGLIIHFMVMHYSGPEQITYQYVMARFSNPLWKVFDVAFLVAVIYHGFSGLWGVAVEYAGSARLLKALQLLILLSSAALFATGIYILTA